jgi:multiple sugar transport system substrate-binding protein
MEANLNSNYPNDNPFNWDVVSLPTFKDLPGVAGQPGPTYLTVSTTSKHRDEAFLSIAQMLSEEVQLERSKDGSVTVLNNFKSAIDVFGQNAPALKGKNVKAITPTKMAEPAVFSKYNTIAQNEISSLIMRVATGEKDLNTALRESAEAIDKQIQTDLAK